MAQIFHFQTLDPPSLRSAHLPVPLSVFALLADPVDGVEVVVGAHTGDGLL